MKFSVYKLFFFNSCFHKIIKRIDKVLDKLLWRISEFIKLYFVGLVCLLDEFPTKWWRQMRKFIAIFMYVV